MEKFTKRISAMKGKKLHILAIILAIIFSPLLLLGILIMAISKAVSDEQDYGRLCD